MKQKDKDIKKEVQSISAPQRRLGGISAAAWGISEFDQATGGIPRGDIAVIETPDYHSGQVVLGHFIYEGLKRGELCAMVTFDSVTTFLENFLLWNIDFQKFLDQEQLILLHYKPNITNEAGLSHEYDQIFAEIQRLSKGQMPARIAFNQIDALVNANSWPLLNLSTQKLEAAANQPLTGQTTILGQFVQFNDKHHHDVAVAMQKTMSGFFSLERQDQSNPHQYDLITRKLPWFQYRHHPTLLKLVEGQGFVLRDGVHGQAA